MVDWNTILKEEHMEGEETNTQAPTGNTGAASAPAPAPIDSANAAATTDEVKTEQAPEPGMKRCTSCGIWYPGGYETCPHDNTKL